LESKRVTLAVFTGTGNTLVAAKFLAEGLRRGGLDVSIVPMEKTEGFSLPDGAALGLAVPLACFSTYPTAWRFIDGLPEGGGREAFFLATMGGLSGGMEGPIRRIAEGKGYRPIGALIVKMPSNYANNPLPVEKNRARVARAESLIGEFAGKLCAGDAKWGGGGLPARFFARLAHSSKPWRTFYRLFPHRADSSKCTGCGVCRDLCPEGSITVENGLAIIGKLCQCCQRCVGFCPAGAISVPGKPAERYSAVPLEELRSFVG
jgi:ferredoxin